MLNRSLILEVKAALLAFDKWLEGYGETSQDHQDFYIGPVGGRAKRLYYTAPSILGHLVVLPMVFCEAFVPSARCLFNRRMRLPISDAHYAMGYASLHETTDSTAFYDRAVHFLEVLEQTRCPGGSGHGWGYPFDWETVGGTLRTGTPLITTTPYCYEAFERLYEIDGKDSWHAIMLSIAEHVLRDYRDCEAPRGGMSCSYTPSSRPFVVNASAYRSFVLTSAAKRFGRDDYKVAANANLRFVLGAQDENGSWPYAVDGSRDFIDHFHTCFVLKALAKIQAIDPTLECAEAITKGVRYYLASLFDEQGLPKPFARKPRMTIYRQELYDYAECLNLTNLLHMQFPELKAVADRVTTDILTNWCKPDGSFRSRRLLIGWDNVPMHRWGQSMMFRSLAEFVRRHEQAAVMRNAESETGSRQ